MWNESDIARAMRSAARAQLPPNARLLRDRLDALYVTDAAADAPEGFSVVRRGAMYALYPNDQWILELERRAEADGDFCESVRRFRGMIPTDEARLLFIRGIKLLDGGASDAEIRLFDRAARSRAAVALRTGAGGGVYAAAILDTQLQNQRR